MVVDAFPAFSDGLKMAEPKIWKVVSQLKWHYSFTFPHSSRATCFVGSHGGSLWRKDDRPTTAVHLFREPGMEGVSGAGDGKHPAQRGRQLCRVVAGSGGKVSGTTGPGSR